MSKVTKQSDRGTYRVWIELEQPIDEEEGKKMADHANRMMRRLGVATESGRWRWSAHEKRWCLHYNMGTYRVLTDNGEWFDLSYVGRQE